MGNQPVSRPTHWSRGQLLEQHPVADFDGEYVAFRQSGEAAKGSFRCTECGYGVVVTQTLPSCPMCSEQVWEHVAWRPFTERLLV